MRLRLVQLELEWPEGVPLEDLRLYLRDQLIAYGEPLRWAITNIEPLLVALDSRKLMVEAVVIVNEKKELSH